MRWDTPLGSMVGVTNSNQLALRRVTLALAAKTIGRRGGGEEVRISRRATSRYAVGTVKSDKCGLN